MQDTCVQSNRGRDPCRLRKFFFSKQAVSARVWSASDCSRTRVRSDLSFNNFVDSIPSSFGGLTVLTYLYVAAVGAQRVWCLQSSRHLVLLLATPVSCVLACVVLQRREWQQPQRRTSPRYRFYVPDVSVRLLPWLAAIRAPPIACANLIAHDRDVSSNYLSGTLPRSLCYLAGLKCLCVLPARGDPCACKAKTWM